MIEEQINNLIKKANSGDKKALELIIIEIKDLIYNLSIKMLLFPQDAEDATQEILIRIITHLSTFNSKSKFSTWVYRVATNYLITYKGKRSKEFAMSFNDYADLIDSGQSNVTKYSKNQGELFLLEEEVKVSCTQGLLLCLNSRDRIIYILSEILEFNSKEGAQIMEITPESYRKQLSRGREKIRNFLNSKCGLANPINPCRCYKKIDYLIQQGNIEPKQLKFAHLSNRSIDLVDKIKALEKTVAIYRSTPNFIAPRIVFDKIKDALEIK